MRRRNFLKIVSFGGALTVAGKMTMDAFSSSGHAHTNSGKRWAMVIDTRKCLEHGNCTKCMDACVAEHNIPKFDNPKDRIKWIWKDKFKDAFITSENQYLPMDINNKNILLLCNHCDNPPCTNVCLTWSSYFFI